MSRREEGFTLVEMLVAITIVLVIVGAVGTAVVVALKNVDATQVRMAESHDAQMAAAYFVTDVQSSTAATTTQPTCATASASIAAFSWSDQGTSNTATYHLETANGERRLRRTHVVGGAGTDVIVAHHLRPQSECTGPTAPDPAVTISEPTSETVLLTLTDATGYAFSLTGERRVR